MCYVKDLEALHSVILLLLSNYHRYLLTHNNPILTRNINIKDFGHYRTIQASREIIIFYRTIHVTNQATFNLLVKAEPHLYSILVLLLSNYCRYLLIRSTPY